MQEAIRDADDNVAISRGFLKGQLNPVLSTCYGESGMSAGA